MQVFIIPFQVRARDASMHAQDKQFAYVSCFIKAEAYPEATRLALEALIRDGYYPESVLEPLYQIEIGQWSEFIKTQWPEHHHALLGQSDFEAAMGAGEVVYGPFGVE